MSVEKLKTNLMAIQITHIEAGTHLAKNNLYTFYTEKSNPQINFIYVLLPKIIINGAACIELRSL